LTKLSFKHIDRDNYNLIISLGFLQLVFYTQNALLFFLSLTNFSFKMHFYYRVDGLKMRRQTEYAGADPGFQVRGHEIPQKFSHLPRQLKNI
jgi:hypothetical protein